MLDISNPQDTNKQFKYFIQFFLIILITSLIFMWISSGNAYLHDFVKNPDDPRRGDLKKLVDVSMGIALFIVVLTLLLGNVTLVILQLCAILIIGITSTIYLGNTENPNFNRDFPTFWITTSIVLNSVLILFGIGVIVTKYIENEAKANNIAEEDEMVGLGLWSGLGSDKKIESRVKALEEMLNIGNSRVSFDI